MKPVVTLSANTSWYLYNFRRSTIKALLECGHRVVCISPKDPYSQRLVELGAEWIPISMDGAGTHPIRDTALAFQLWRAYRAFRPLAAFHFTVKNNIYGTLAARAVGSASVNNVSGLGTAFIHSGWITNIVRFLYRTSQPLAFRVFCQNREDFELLLAQKLVPRDKLELLPGSGVDLSRFHPSLVVAREPGAPLRILYSGRILADKGVRELIEAFCQIKSEGICCELFLCGFVDTTNRSAIDEATLQSWRNLPGIHWLGSSDSMENVYAHSDAVVLPSYREGMPRTILEAGAMGLPVVVTDVPGCRDIVTHRVNGLICEARSVESLVSALKELLAMSDSERSALGQAGRSRVERDYDERTVVNAAIRAVNEIIVSQSRR